MTLDPATVVGGLLSPALVFLAVIVPWRGVLSTRNDLHQDLMLLPWALVTAVLWHPGLLRGLLGSHHGDPLPGSALLATVLCIASLVLFAGSVMKTRTLRRRFMRRATLAPAAADLVLTMLLGLLSIVLVSPLLRAAYHKLFAGPVPVAGFETPSLAGRLRSLSVPVADGSLAEHAAAVVLWTLLIACLFGWLLDVRRRRRSLGALQAGAVAAGLALLSWMAALALG